MYRSIKKLKWDLQASSKLHPRQSQYQDPGTKKLSLKTVQGQDAVWKHHSRSDWFEWLFGGLVFNGTFSINRLYRAMSAQKITPTTHLLYTDEQTRIRTPVLPLPKQILSTRLQRRMIGVSAEKRLRPLTWWAISVVVFRWTTDSLTVSVPGTTPLLPTAQTTRSRSKPACATPTPSPSRASECRWFRCCAYRSFPSSSSSFRLVSASPTQSPARYNFTSHAKLQLQSQSLYYLNTID